MGQMPKKNAGVSLVEVVIASAIVLLLSVVLISANMAYFKSASLNLKNIKAIYLAEEGVEAVTFLKNKDWNNLGTVGTNYYLTWENNGWVATTTAALIDGEFNRQFFTQSVNRDSNSDITLAGGTLDTNTRKLTVQVTWSDSSGSSTKSISAYLMKTNE